MYKFKFLLVILFACAISPAHAQFYPVSAIPDSLKQNASLIVRSETREIVMRSANSGTEKIIRILTVLNKSGEDVAALQLRYDKNSTIKINEISYYSASGEKTSSVRQSEITDIPLYGSTLFAESRVKSFKASQPAYPYTVKYDYEISIDNLISFACWRPLNNYNISVQHSVLFFIHPADIKINIREVNVKPVSSENRNGKVEIGWELKNLKAIEDEPLDISLAERVPAVYLMPSRLIYEKYEGTADNWKDCGKWFYELYRGRDEISEAEKPIIDTLLKGITETDDRIEALYKYMQENTRYVAVFIGLGGYQPFDAKTVFETGYGDCKALTNYLHALLRYAGIESFSAAVSSGNYKESIFLDFPNFQQFDHVILCVPQKNDTLWLECTNQKIPLGFLGDFTDDRDVLLITETGGHFAHTTRYDLKDNLRNCRSEFSIDSTGAALCSSSTSYEGLQYDNISFLFNTNYEEQKKWLYSSSSLPSLQIKNFTITENKNILPSAKITQSSISKNYCSFSGKYMVLPLNILNAQSPIQKMLKKRQSDIIISRSSVDYDTLVYKIPKNYKHESIPTGSIIDSKFGSYSWSVSAKEGEIVFTRKFTLLEGRYKPSDYKELYDFILSVSKADNTKILLTKL